ncbi:amidoligase family protein [Oceanicella actignis]|uniref:amidoligase family protein n=1 Tax=Oceanicella actignis TaxID=1189325 RepID=UPI0011E74039|nr:amidoligase family protein [Oceanicella actignis]TYO90146.1 putative amidoligase enzyme [Oceanicella actignis]
MRETSEQGPWLPADPREDAGAGAARWLRPPRPLAQGGRERLLGVELEFSGLSAAEAAEAVVRVFGGRARQLSEHRALVEGAEAGDFEVELDFRWAHDGARDPRLRKILGDLGEALLPMEVVCPPIPLSRAPRLEALREALRRAGARGVEELPLHALGAQLNPELPDLGVGYILRAARAYLLLSDWLRDEIQPTAARRILMFARPFPAGWGRLILDPDYAPSPAGFIDDYLRWNPTRNRELDLLPLLAHLDEERVRRALPDEKINPRPTWHWRLPNALVDDPDWTLSLEWNRWVTVERLAERPDLIARHARVWIEDSRLPLALDRVEHARAILDEL